MNIPYLPLEHKGIKYYLCRLSCETILKISYVAQRGVNDEQGAVQRILNKARISNIASYLINGGFFPTNIILNLIDDTKITINEEQKTLLLVDKLRFAQVLDGQHRVAGMRDAIKEKPELRDVEFPVLLAVGLTTAQCAEIFVNINTEQRTVPKSLIYDLYGLIETPNKDYSIERGRDIAQSLNADEDSPYMGYIKFPGTTRFKGGIQLSSIVNALRPLVKPQGEFEKYQVRTLEYQAKVLKNYFNAIQYYYEKKWFELSNPFLYVSGFSAAIEVLIQKILPYCFSQKSFSFDTFKSVIGLSKDSLIKQADVKGKSGEAAKEYIYEKFSEYINVENIGEDDLEF